MKVSNLEADSPKKPGKIEDLIMQLSTHLISQNFMAFHCCEPKVWYTFLCMKHGLGEYSISYVKTRQLCT